MTYVEVVDDFSRCVFRVGDLLFSQRLSCLIALFLCNLGFLLEAAVFVPETIALELALDEDMVVGGWLLFFEAVVIVVRDEM